VVEEDARFADSRSLRELSLWNQIGQYAQGLGGDELTADFVSRKAACIEQ
jgi:hypothetical protein